MSTRQHYIRLVDGFCEHCGLDEPERILQGGPIAVDEVVFSLIYSEAVDAELLFIYADYGKVPRGDETRVFRALLEMNLRLYTGRGPALTLSDESGRVVRADHRRLADLTPPALYALLQQIAVGAKAWRDDPTFGKALRRPSEKAPYAAIPTAAVLRRRPRDSS